MLTSAHFQEVSSRREGRHTKTHVSYHVVTRTVYSVSQKK